MSKQWRELKDDEIIQEGDMWRFKDETERSPETHCVGMAYANWKVWCPDIVAERRIKPKPSKWHILEDDPTDLPDTCRNVIVEVEGQKELVVDFFRKDLEWAYHNRESILAWREMPKRRKVTK